MLIEDRVEISDLTIQRGTRHTLQLVQLLHIIGMEEVADRVNGIVIRVQRLIKILSIGNLAAQQVNDTVAAGHIGFTESYTLDGVFA